MPKHSRTKPRTEDVNEAAFRVVREATRDRDEVEPAAAAAVAAADEDEEPREKNPAAVTLGRLGGKKGGPARAKALSAERRREIARKAAEARWRKDSQGH